jgi:hypothetical protein
MENEKCTICFQFKKEENSNKCASCNGVINHNVKQMKKTWIETETENLQKENNQKFADMVLSGSREDSMKNHTKTLKETFGFHCDEWVDLSKKRHAEIVYRKCLTNKKYNLAQKIKEKYNLYSKRDDSVIAFGMALMVSKDKI